VFVGLGTDVDQLFGECLEAGPQISDAVVGTLAHQVLGAQQQLSDLILLHFQSIITFLHTHTPNSVTAEMEPGQANSPGTRPNPVTIDPETWPDPDEKYETITRQWYDRKAN